MNASIEREREREEGEKGQKEMRRGLMWTEKRKILSTFSSSSSSKHLQFPVIHRSHPNPLFSSLIIIFLFYLLIFSSIRLLHVSPSTQTNPNSQFPIPFFIILPKLFSSPFPVPNSQFPIPFFFNSSQAFQFPIPSSQFPVPNPVFLSFFPSFSVPHSGFSFFQQVNKKKFLDPE